MLRIQTLKGEVKGMGREMGKGVVGDAGKGQHRKVDGWEVSIAW